MNRWLGRSVLAVLEGRREDAVHESEHFLRSCRDPESFYYLARHLAFLGYYARTLSF